MFVQTSALFLSNYYYLMLSIPYHFNERKEERLWLLRHLT